MLEVGWLHPFSAAYWAYASHANSSQLAGTFSVSADGAVSNHTLFILHRNLCRWHTKNDRIYDKLQWSCLVACNDFISSFFLADLGTITGVIASVVTIIAVVGICGVVISIVAVYRRRSKCSCACSDLESVKPYTNEREKSPSQQFVSQHIVSQHTVKGYHCEEIVVRSDRPESICEKNLDNFELPDQIVLKNGDEYQKKTINSKDECVWHSCIVLCHTIHLVWHTFPLLYLVVALLFRLSVCLAFM